MGQLDRLEHYRLLASGARGSALIDILRKAIADRELHVFGELLDLPAVVELNDPVVDALRIFSYGTLEDYMAQEEKLPVLTVEEKQKLRRLTLLSIVRPYKRVPYAVIAERMQLDSVRELEDLVIDAQSYRLIQCRLDQRAAVVLVEDRAGRDVTDNDIEQMLLSLNRWKSTAEKLVQSIDGQIRGIVDTKQRDAKTKEVGAATPMESNRDITWTTTNEGEGSGLARDSGDGRSGRTEKRRKG
uniref:PCI domain-containing protein n=1 Tax=Compsopogon caeruleus TaxID=31354 RepID=A0A7S1XAZ6_9RHOD|mmetsp:Transcript_11449/g.23234  ORF Transcript_11449/g.23234 Transcript_11449/m.23234 type:complete len:243 (+) Transcript_11449:46-774(+)